MGRQQRRGWIEIICGCMFSGKTEELIRRVRRAELAGQQVQIFGPLLDKHYYDMVVTSHDGQHFDFLPVTSAEEIIFYLHEDTSVVAIDEVQFFDWSIAGVLASLASRGYRVIATGLDLDFLGEPFGPMPILMAQAEEVTKLHAICIICGKPAHRTQRLIDGRPARPNESQQVPGVEERYEARCRHCHQVPQPVPLGRRPEQDRP